jgi:DNA end-binding protein Ku
VARPIWTGVISFGLVSVPVRLYSATQEHDVSFHQFERDTEDRIRYQRINERTGKEVDYDDIVRGADVGDGKYVLLDPKELESVAPGRSRSLDIHTFVELDEIDPIYFQRTYYLAPGSPETAKTYALLRDAMAEAHRAAIGTLVMRGKEYLAAIRPDGDLLVLETMYFADEIRDPRKELDRVPGSVKLNPGELRMAKQLIDSMAGSWQPNDFHDTYTERVKDLIAAKKRGKKITVAEAAPEPTNVTDLMEVLRRSVDNAQRGRPGGRRTTTTTTTTAGATATTARKRPTSAKRTGRAASTKPPARATTARKRPAVAELSKGDLLELARQKNVAGRSTMTRSELEEAVGGRRAS